MRSKTQETSDSLIRQWLWRFGVNFQKETAPYLPLWLETFGGMEPEVLRSLFERAMRTCTFFPTVAEILAPLEVVEQGSFEDEWQALLDYCERWVNRDVPNMQGKPALPADIDHAARAAGGLYYLESCSVDDLVWAKKRFIEDLARQRKTGDIAGFLPGSELRELLKNAAPRFQLPPAAADYFGLPGARPALTQSKDERDPREVLQEFANAEPGRTYTRCPKHSAEVSAMIAQGETARPVNIAEAKKQAEKDCAAWLAAHGIRAAELVAAVAAHPEAVKQGAAQ